MKQFKKLTRNLKIAMTRLGMTIDNWALKEETPSYWVLVNKSSLAEMKLLKK